MELFTRCYRALRYRKITKSLKLLAILSKYRDVQSENVTVNESGRLVIRDTNVEIDKIERRFLLQGIQLLDDLRRRASAILTSDKDGRIILHVCGVKVILRCWEELFIAHEIFYRKLYNVSLKKPFHVVDVGMNTGTSALFFAAYPECRRVDAYELFPQTAERATENLTVNPELSHKISAHHFGLGARDEELLLDYFAEFKGSVGVNGLPDYAKPHGVELHSEKVSVQIHAVGPIVRELLSQTDVALVLKLDCEGAEYEILSSLQKENLLQRFAIVMIEWHLRGPSVLAKILEDSGFTYLSFDECSGTHGMLYGFKLGEVAEKANAAL
jgi:FkbM family methyltransferase